MKVMVHNKCDEMSQYSTQMPLKENWQEKRVYSQQLFNQREQVHLVDLPCNLLFLYWAPYIYVLSYKKPIWEIPYFSTLSNLHHHDSRMPCTKRNEHNVHSTL